MARKKKPDDQRHQPADLEYTILPSAVLRELVNAETFRVWHNPSDPHQVGEFVVTIATDGVRVWETHNWHPSKLNATDDHDGGDSDSHDGFLLTWAELVMIGGRGRELVDDTKSEIREIQRELQTWVSIRSREAHRIARAREIERQANMRQILHDAAKVIDVWIPPRRKRVTWRDMVRRQKE